MLAARSDLDGHRHQFDCFQAQFAIEEPRFLQPAGTSCRYGAVDTAIETVRLNISTCGHKSRCIKPEFLANIGHLLRLKMQETGCIETPFGVLLEIAILEEVPHTLVTLRTHFRYEICRWANVKARKTISPIRYSFWTVTEIEEQRMTAEKQHQVCRQESPTPADRWKYGRHHESGTRSLKSTIMRVSCHWVSNRMS